jgi:cell division protein FtsZ
MGETPRGDGYIDYRHLDRPAVVRKQMQSQIVKPQPAKIAAESPPDVDYLDIPAFLRREEEVQ